MPRLLYHRRRDRVSTVLESGWPAGPFWTGVENLAPSGIRFPERAVLSESLYRLRNARYTSQILTGESEGKRPFGRLRCTAQPSMCLWYIVIFRTYFGSRPQINSMNHYVIQTKVNLRIQGVINIHCRRNLNCTYPYFFSIYDSFDDVISRSRWSEL
jgi:hypothetical protein